jgi:ankyrin repeat protein
VANICVAVRRIVRTIALASLVLSGCAIEDAGFDCGVEAQVAKAAKETSKLPPEGFYEAARNGDVRQVREYISSGVDVDGADAEVILKAEDGYEIRNRGATALILAANSGHFDVAEALACAGANVNAETDAGETALHRATDRGDEKLVRALLIHGADTSPQPTGFVGTVLHTASGMGEIGIVQALLDAGANPNALGPSQITPLQIAINEGNDEVVELLLERGALPDPQAQGSPTTALHIAATKGDLAAVRLLLAHSANPDSLNHEGSTPLLEAVAEENTRVAELLLRHGANPNIRNSHLDSALSWAVYKDNTDLVRTLLDNGADPLLQDRDGETALAFAKSERVRKLLRHAAATAE